jgi:FdhD protein
MNDLEPCKKVRSYTYRDKQISAVSSELLVETPLEVLVNGERYSFIMCTPGHTKELVYGFIFTEGLIQHVREIKRFAIALSRKQDGEEVIEARVEIPSQHLLPLAFEGRRVSYSSCGICGTESYEQLKRAMGRVKSRYRFSMGVLNALPDKLEKFQPLYKRTGGAHAAMVFDAEGEAVFYCEDMGRHNALDKVIGCALMSATDCGDKILVSSGRGSLEMILKTARGGFPVFVAMSRPTARAVEAAKFYNITLVDMAKGANRIYTHVRRIQGF